MKTSSDSPNLETPIMLSFNEVKLIHVMIFYIHVHINFSGSQVLSGLVMIPAEVPVAFF